MGGTTSLAVERPVSVVAAAGLTVRQPDPSDPVVVADRDQTASVVVAGDAQPGATVTVTIDDRDAVQVPAASDGTWSLGVDDLGVGEHHVTATQTVGGSTSTTPVSTAFTVEAAAPARVTTPTPDTGYRVGDADATTTIDVAGTAGPGATVVVDLGDGRSGSTTVDQTGAWTNDKKLMKQDWPRIRGQSSDCVSSVVVTSSIGDAGRGVQRRTTPAAR